MQKYVVNGAKPYQIVSSLVSAMPGRAITDPTVELDIGDRLYHVAWESRLEMPYSAPKTS